MSTKTAARPAPKRKPAARKQGLPLFPIVIGAVVVLGIVAVVAVSLSGDGETADDRAQYGTVTVAGEALPPMPSSGTDSAFGLPAPELQGNDFDGKPVSIPSESSPKAIAFVAHWCPHCRAEVPQLNAWLDGGGLPEGVDLFIVPTSTSESQPNYPPSQWLEEEGLADVPTLVDDDQGTAHAAYGGGAFPYFVFVDADGNVSGRLTGEMPGGSADYDAIFAQLAAGEPVTDPRLDG